MVMLLEPTEFFERQRKFILSERHRTIYEQETERSGDVATPNELASYFAKYPDPDNSSAACFACFYAMRPTFKQL